MTIAQTIKRMPTTNTQLFDAVPAVGELIVDATSDRIKIGDGVTAIKDLPWVDFGLDLAKEESSLSRDARMFIENNIDLIENNDYDTLYYQISTPVFAHLAQEVTRALLKAGLNPKPYLSKIPQSIRHILEPDEVWAEDTSRLYTRSELDAKVHEVTSELIDKINKIKENI